MDLLGIANAAIFKPSKMTKIIQDVELLSSPDDFILTDMYIPRKDSDDNRLIAAVKNAAFGVTSAGSVGAEPRHIPGLGVRYKEAKVPYWIESVIHDENELLNIRNPENPDEIWGLNMMVADMKMLDYRLRNRIEQTTSDSVYLNGFSINNSGVIYTYSAGVSPRYRIYMGNTVPSGFIATPWRSKSDNYLWTATATATPIKDLVEMVRHFGQMGLTVTDITMNGYTSGLFTGATSTQTTINNLASGTGKYMGLSQIFTAVGDLNGITPHIDNRTYQLESYIVTAAAIGVSTITVRDSAELGVSASSYFLGINSNDDEELLQVHASTPINTATPGAHVITLAAVTTLAYGVNDRVMFTKGFTPDGYISFGVKKTSRTDVANWITIPSYVGKADGKPKPGIFNWSKVTPGNEPPIKAEVGIGVAGGPVVFRSGGWGVAKVA